MAFPVTTNILSTFTTDENPIYEQGNWRDEGLEASPAKKASGACTGTIADYFDTVYQTYFGPSCEFFITLNNYPKTGSMIYRIKHHQGSSAPQGYLMFIDVGAPENWDIEVVVNGSGTIIGGPVTQAIASGDSLGMSYDLGALNDHYKSGAGSWTTVVGPISDSTYATQTGKVSLEAFGTQQLDNFGAGNLGSQPCTMTKAVFPHPILRAPTSQGRVI